MKIKNILTGAAASILMLGAMIVPAFADTVTSNFENPPFNLGVINGQDGWMSLGAAGAGCAVYDQAVANSLGTVGFGLQSLRISDAVTSGCFGDQVFAKPLVDSVGETAALPGAFSVGTKQSHFETQFDIASAVPTAQQPGMHVSVSPDRGDGSRMSYLRFEDGVAGIDVFFDEVRQPGPCVPTGCANFVESQVGTGLDRTVPHTIKLTMDTLDGPGNDVVSVYIDGTLIHTGTSWEDYYRYDPEASIEPGPRIVKTVLFRSSGAANSLDQGKGFLFDNLTVKSGPVLVGPPTSKDQCKKDGWKIFNNPTFRNQGQCVAYVEHNKRDEEDSSHEDEDRGHSVDRHEIDD